MKYVAMGRYIWDAVNGCIYAEASTGVIAENTARQLNLMVEVRTACENSPRLHRVMTEKPKYVGFRKQNMMYAGSGI